MLIMTLDTFLPTCLFGTTCLLIFAKFSLLHAYLALHVYLEHKSKRLKLEKLARLTLQEIWYAEDVFLKTNSVSGAALHLLQCFVLDAKNTNVILCRQKSVSHRLPIIFWQD